MRWFLLALVACHSPTPDPVIAVAPVDAGPPPPTKPVVRADGESCVDDGDYTCSPDAESLLHCEKKNWRAVAACNGARGCVTTDKKTTCDNTIASIGARCLEDDDYACSPDGKTALVCKSSAFAFATDCGGPNGCKVIGDETNGTQVSCDDSIAAVGSQCEKENHFTCTADGRTILRCTSRTYVVDSKCKKTESCKIKDDEIGCY